MKDNLITGRLRPVTRADWIELIDRNEPIGLPSLVSNLCDTWQEGTHWCPIIYTGEYYLLLHGQNK